MDHDTAPTPPAEWDACPVGELQRLGRERRRSVRQRRLVAPIAATAAVVAVTAVLWSSGRFSPGGIGCATCVARFDGYHEYLLRVDAGQPPVEEDARLAEVRRHLEGCESCRGAFERAYPDVAGVTAALSAGFATAIAGLAVAATARRRAGRPTTQHSPLWPTGL